MVGSLFRSLHTKRAESLANYSVGVMQASSVAIHAIGAAYAEVAGTRVKHGVKQVDRYLSNQGIDVEALTAEWAEFVIGPRKAVHLIVDWTDFELDDQTTLCACVVCQGAGYVIAVCRVAPGRLRPGAPTDPDVRNSRIRLLGLWIRCASIDALDDSRSRQWPSTDEAFESPPRHRSGAATTVQPEPPCPSYFIEEAL